MENFKLNPPPSWPPFPVGWTPGPGWQPGRDLPPVPLCWQLWVPVDVREAAPDEIDVTDYIDPFAAYLPGATTINRTPAPVYETKAVFKEKRVKTVFVSTWIIGPALVISSVAAGYVSYKSGGWIHAAVAVAAVLAVTAFLTGVYTIATGRPGWAQLQGGRGVGVRPLMLSLFLCALILGTTVFGLDVPPWVPVITLPKL